MQKDIKIEERGVIETAHRVKLIIGQVFRYAIATDRAESDPTVALRGALQTRKEVHYGMIAEPAQVSGLIRAGYFSLPLSGCAVRAHVLGPNLLHPGEICHTEWCEIDLDRQEWWIPAEKLKMKRDHNRPTGHADLEASWRDCGAYGDRRVALPPPGTMGAP